MIAVGGVDSIVRFYTPQLKNVDTFHVQSWIHIVKWHPEHPILAVGRLEGYTLLIHVRSGKRVALNHKTGTRALDWNSDGTMLAVADLDGQITIWDTTGTLLKTIARVYSPETAGTAFLAMDWHPTTNVFVAANYALTVFDTSGQILPSFQHPNPAAIMLCVAWHPSGEFFVVGDYGHNWEGENVPSLLHFWSGKGQYIRKVEGSKAEYRNIAWHPEGKWLATASDVLRIWDTEGHLLFTGKQEGSDYLWGIDWNPEGTKIVTSSRYQHVVIRDDKTRPLRRILAK